MLHVEIIQMILIWITSPQLTADINVTLRILRNREHHDRPEVVSYSLSIKEKSDIHFIFIEKTVIKQRTHY